MISSSLRVALATVWVASLAACSSTKTQEQQSACEDAASCTAANECQVPFCEAGRCGTSAVAAGTAVSNQVAGDCGRNVCDGNGAVTRIADDGDAPAPVACRTANCSDGVVQHGTLPAGSACTSEGGSFCDGAGQCVQCLVASDCPGQDTACTERTCVAGVCGQLHAQAGARVDPQVVGECHVSACDGAGNVVSLVDDADVPDDANPCTEDSCSLGVALHAPAVYGTACLVNGGTVCDGAGACVDPCQVAAAAGASEGCEFWLADLGGYVDVSGLGTFGCEAPRTESLLPVCYDEEENRVSGLCDYGGSCSGSADTSCQMLNVCALDLQHRSFDVLLANPGSLPASVTVEDAFGATAEVQVDAGSSASMEITAPVFSDLSLDSSLLGARAYRIRSDVPVAAWRRVQGLEGSLLVPVGGLSNRYTVWTAPGVALRPAQKDANSYLTVVATSALPTEVQIVPGANVRAGAGVGAVSAGVPVLYMLQPFDVLNLEGASGADLSGSVVTSESPVAVFSGHHAAGIGSPGCCLGPIEEQALPTVHLGTHFGLLRSPDRGAQADRVLVVAVVDHTSLLWDPPLGGAPTALLASQSWEGTLPADMTLTTTSGVVVTRLLARFPSFDFTRRPASTSVVPTSRFRTSHVVTIPPDVSSAFLSIIAPVGGGVSVDGSPVGAQLATPVGQGGVWSGGHVAAAPGFHRITCTPACGVEVHGYTGDGSAFAWPAGLDLR